ncbi:hypothetical protein J6TS7_13530 [Paenibacillus dendritiformis]|uniref:hypothetical protein n=1 Tax=Paenibacillus TaxID=44249 RepID=UPI001B2C1C1F|nr:hypothetical protein J6TS7_13530 [Paenibacillus dendritiformis]
MDQAIQKLFSELESEVKDFQYEALQKLLAVTDKEVDWAYEVLDQLLGWLTDRENHKDPEQLSFSLI